VFDVDPSHKPTSSASASEADVDENEMERLLLQDLISEPGGATELPLLPSSAASSSSCEASASQTTTTMLVPADLQQNLERRSQEDSQSESLGVPEVIPERGPGASSAALIDMKICMCHAGFTLGIPIDLPALARAIPNSVMQPVDRPRSVVIRALRHPRFTCIVRPSGKIHVATQCEGEMARTLAKRGARLVQKRYSKFAAFKHYKVYHMVVRASLPCGIDIEGFAETLLPEGPPFISILRASESGKATVDVETGKGSRQIRILVDQRGALTAYRVLSVQEARDAMEALVPVLQRHRLWW